MNIAKRVLTTTVAAAITAAGLLTATLSPAHASCTTFVYRTTVDLHAYEGTSYDDPDWFVFAGTWVRGTGGSRSNGWTPVENWSTTSDSGPWTPPGGGTFLQGSNDTHDFIRTSGLDFIKCA